MGDGFGAIENGVALLSGKREVTIFFEEFFGFIPPLLEIWFPEDGWNQDFGELILSHPVLVLGEDSSGELNGVLSGLCTDGGGIFRNSGQNMVVGQGFERLGRILKLHGVTGFGREVDDDLIEVKILSRYFADPPAFVDDTGSFGEVLEGFCSGF